MIIFSARVCQGQLVLFWTVYSEEKLQSCLKLRNFQNPFDKVKTVGPLEIPCTKKDLKFAPIVELANLKFTYITVVGPGFDESP